MLARTPAPGSGPSAAKRSCRERASFSGRKATCNRAPPLVAGLELGSPPKSGFAVFMGQQPHRGPRAERRARQRRPVQRFFGNASLAPLGFAFIQGEEPKTQQIDQH
jgi:hypothetical protein